MQANKASLDKANTQEGRDWGTFAGNYGAVEWYTNAAQSADLLIGVFQDTRLRKAGVIKLSCIRSRGVHFDPFLVQVEPVTRAVHVLASGEDVLMAESVIIAGPLDSQRTAVRRVKEF